MFQLLWRLRSHIVSIFLPWWRSSMRNVSRKRQGWGRWTCLQSTRWIVLVYSTYDCFMRWLEMSTNGNPRKAGGGVESQASQAESVLSIQQQPLHGREETCVNFRIHLDCSSYHYSLKIVYSPSINGIHILIPHHRLGITPSRLNMA